MACPAYDSSAALAEDHFPVDKSWKQDLSVFPDVASARSEPDCPSARSEPEPEETKSGRIAGALTWLGSLPQVLRRSVVVDSEIQLKAKDARNPQEEEPEDQLPEKTEDTVGTALQELQIGHEILRKVAEEKHTFEMKMMNAKLEASMEMRRRLDDQMKSLREEMQAPERKQEEVNAASSAELRAVRDEIGVLELQTDSLHSEVAERHRDIQAAHQYVDDLTLHVAEHREKSLVAKAKVQASEQEREAPAAELASLQRQVLTLREDDRQKLLALESRKNELAGANGCAERWHKEFEKLTLALRDSCEQHQDLVKNVEGMRKALDDANARAEGSAESSKKATAELKDALLAAEQNRRIRQEELEAQAQADWEACDLQRRAYEFQVAACKQELQKADSRAKKYKDHAKEVKQQLEQLQQEKQEHLEYFHTHFG